MEPRPFFDRALLIALAIGFLSILGLGWIFLLSDRVQSLLPPTAIPSRTSIMDVWTPPPAPSDTPTQDEVPPTATATSTDAYPSPTIETPSSTSIVITETLPPPSATYTPVQIQSLPAGKYDDTNPNILYDPYWQGLKNPGTENAYKGTLHVSTNTGSETSFRFTGQGFRLGYQRGRNFGTVTVLIDGQPYSFHEEDFALVWRSPALTPGDHFVQIIHDSGESVNLDYIEVLD